VVYTDGGTPWPDERLENNVTLVVCLVGEHATDLSTVPDWAIGIKVTKDTAVKRDAA
jgi:hypothetical protein